MEEKKAEIKMNISMPSNSKGGLEYQGGQHFGKVLNYTM